MVFLFGQFGSYEFIISHLLLCFVIKEMVNQLIYFSNELKSCFDILLFNYLVKCRRIRLTILKNGSCIRVIQYSYLVSCLTILSEIIIYSPWHLHIYISSGMGKIHAFPQRNRGAPVRFHSNPLLHEQDDLQVCEVHGTA